MFDSKNVKQQFLDFIEKGYSLIFDEKIFFLLNRELGVLIKVGYVEYEKSIGSCLIKCEPEQFANNETTISLNEFQLEFDSKINVELDNIEKALQKLHDEIIENHGFRVFGVSIDDTFFKYCMDLMTLYSLSSDTKKYGVMSENLYLWNEQFGLVIERNYDDWHLGCAVFKYKKKDDFILPIKVIPLELILNEDKKNIATSEDLTDQGQASYFNKLNKFLIAEKDALLENVESDQFDWREVSGRGMS